MELQVFGGKSVLKDAGGWQSDTLTEDLDLSYRAQLKGWQFKYMEDVVSPAELPIIMSAVKSHSTDGIKEQLRQLKRTWVK